MTTTAMEAQPVHPAGQRRRRLRLPQDPVRRVVLAVFVVALANGLLWSLLTPPFEVPDETAHIAYAQHLAETGRRAGETGHPEYSDEQAAVMNAMAVQSIVGHPLQRTPPAGGPDRSADAAIQQATRTASRSNGGGPSTASSQPPLYYALAAIPYRMFSWASLPVRLEAMRVLSAVLFALSAALAAWLVAELLPGRSWAALVGGLAVGLSPYAAFVGSGVTPDVLLLLIGTATLLIAVRAIRHGLTTRRAVALGLAVGAGAMTKLTFLPFVPVALLVFVVLLWRDRAALRAERRGMPGVIAAGVAAGVVLPALFVLWVGLIGMPIMQAGTSTPSLSPDQIHVSNTREFASYTWQLYLPRLWFMTELFGGRITPDIAWVQGFAGRLGWLDYDVAPRVIDVFRRVIEIGIVLIVAAAIQWRHALWRNRLALAALAAFSLALMLVISKAGYDFRRTTGTAFEQPRYLLPIAGVWALGVAFACLGLGRRLAPVLAIVVVGLLCLHDLAGILATLARYYA
ncbi:MAG TPA: DUF2142 domain-containing protein [Baekduia sp.]|nr:DUF2142 domain-containing protein [Baekduia sp.]